MHIREHSILAPDRPALLLYPSGVSITFAEVESRSNRLAHHLRRRGLHVGQAVAVLMDNNEHFLTVMWAARRAGLYYVPVSTHLTAPEIAHIVQDCGAGAIVGSAATAAQCAAVVQHLDSPPDIRLMADSDLTGWQRYPECVANEPDTPITDESEGDLLQYSSGTTGRPKGIRRPLSEAPPEATASPIAGLLDALGLGSESCYLSPAPLYHTAPVVWSMSAQSVGATVVVMERFDAAGALDAIERHRVTHAQFVPTMFVRMLKLPTTTRAAHELGSLRRVVHAAAPCPVPVKHEMIRWWGPIIDEFYSSSEGAGVTFITAQEWLERPGSVGRPVLGRAHILDENGIELPHGETGEVFFEGGYSFDYLNDPAKTAAARNMAGWVSVGDMGHLDGDGYLYLTDRRHHMIISGGVNIYPREAEDVLVSHPDVLDAAVIGIPDPEMGQQVTAVVQPVNPSDATPAFAGELLSWVRDRLAHYKCPRSIVFDAQLPRTATGKMLKAEVVARHSPLEPNQ